MRSVLERLRLPLLTASGAAPVALLLAFADGVPWVTLWPAAFALAGWGCLLLNGKKRLLLALAWAVGFAAGGVCCCVHMPCAAVIVPPVMYAILLLVMLPQAVKMDDRDAPAVWVFAGMTIHVLAQCAVSLSAGAGAASPFAGVQAPLTAVFILFLLLALMTMNNMSLHAAMPDAAAVPASIRQRNRLLVWLLAALTLLLALLPVFGQILAKAWTWITQTVSAVLQWFFSLKLAEYATAPGGADAGMDLSGLGEIQEPSLWMVWVERIALALTALVTVLLLVIALRFLGKKLLVLLRYLLARLQSYAASATEDYVDEWKDTRETGEVRSTKGLLRRRGPTEKELRSLPPREQIRRRYALLRSKHPEWKASATARQTLPDESAGLYERARYSSHDVDAADALRFAQQAGKDK